MRIEIIIDNDTSSTQIVALSRALLALTESDHEAQPAVASNTGSLSSVPTVHDRSPSEGQAVTQEVETPPAPVKKGRKAKEEPTPEPIIEPTTEPTPEPTAEEPAPAPAPAPAPEAEAAPAPTLDEVRAALQAFASTKGVPEGLELLKQFNASRISELDEAHYAAFVARCNAGLAS